MEKTRTIGAIIAAVVFVASGTQMANASPGSHGHNHSHNSPEGELKAAEIKAQTVCPVMGGAIHKDLYVEHDGKRIYVCCKGCIAAIQADPAKYIEKLESEGITLEPADAPPFKDNSHQGADHAGHRH